MTLYLASKSPRRRHLLDRLGVRYEVLDVDVEEVPAAGESPEDYVRRVALDKAGAGSRLVGPDDSVLAADTEVILDGRILGKPADAADCIAMLGSLSGRSHEVYTAVALIGNGTRTLLSRNIVTFRVLTTEERQDYCETCRPLDKAGAYGIQDKGAGFIDRLEGSFSSVMGLPLKETEELLKKVRSEES